MSVIDIHNHVTPLRFVEAIDHEGQWHTLGPDVGELHIPKFSISAEDRIAEMDAMGVDIHVLTINTGFFKYELEASLTRTIAEECNDALREMMNAYPERFLGLASIPLQDVPMAIDVMNHAMSELGFKGITISDHVNGVTLDDKRFDPFWRSVEELGAVVFFHQASATIVEDRTTRYGLPNVIGNLVERTITFGTLVYGGVLDRYPDLKLCLGHAGGYTAFGAARMDKGWRAGALDDMPEFEDSCTYTEATLRFLIDIVGVEQVVLGTDYPAPMFLEDPVNWINGLDSLSSSEKKAILETNPERLLGL
jgi:aminocarboxymuconate-semialdehyde decarboxylase